MTYTFDEAIEELEKLQGSAGYATQGEPEALRFSGLDVKWFLNEATQVIEKLREEYAPTVEMTTFERTNAVGLLDFKRDELTFVVGSDGDGTPILDTLPKEYFSAWLHQETIKIKGD